MSQAIEALLRAVDELNPRVRDVQWANVVNAAAAVRASLAREPVELSDEELDRAYDAPCEGHTKHDFECHMVSLRAVARAARGESK